MQYLNGTILAERWTHLHEWKKFVVCSITVEHSQLGNNQNKTIELVGDPEASGYRTTHDTIRNGCLGHRTLASYLFRGASQKRTWPEPHLVPHLVSLEIRVTWHSKQLTLSIAMALTLYWRLLYMYLPARPLFQAYLWCRVSLSLSLPYQTLYHMWSKGGTSPVQWRDKHWRGKSHLQSSWRCIETQPSFN